MIVLTPELTPCILEEWLTPPYETLAHAWNAMGKILYGGGKEMWGGVGWGNDDMQTR